MSVLYKIITKEEFKESSLPTLFTPEGTERGFATIRWDNIGYKFSRQSDLIEPQIIEASNEIAIIGIDQYLSIIDIASNTILHKIGLSYFLSEVIVMDSHVYIATELEIMVYDFNINSIINQFPLPDIYEELVFHNNKVQVKCFGNQEINIT